MLKQRLPETISAVQQVTLADVLTMFESEYSEDIFDRKAREALKFLETRPKGFFYEELNDITRLTNYILVDIVRGYVEEMKEPFLQILAKAKLGFQKVKIFDDQKNFYEISKFLNILVPVMYDFVEITHLDCGEEPIHEILVEGEDLDDIKFAVIEFLFYFLKEDYDMVKEAETLKSKPVKEKKKRKKNQMKMEVLGRPGEIVRECKKIYVKQNFGDEELTNERDLYMNSDLKTEGTKNFRALDHSDLPEAIVYFLQHNAEVPELYIFALEVLNYSVMYINLVEKLCSLGLLKDIIYLVFDKKEDFRSYPVRLCFEILWNSIERMGRKAIENIATEDIVFAMRELFLDIMRKGYKLEDKCLRNELLILINYIFTHHKMVPFLIENKYISEHNSEILKIPNQKRRPLTDDELEKLNFLEILLYFSTVDESIFADENLHKNTMKAVFGLTTEDLEFKKLILSGILLAVESNDRKILETVGTSNFLSSLLLYIDPLTNCYAVNRWSTPQSKEIQIHCLNILSNLILYMKDYFIDQGGLPALTKFLNNSSDIDRKEKCLRAFVNASMFDEACNLKIADEGVIDLLLDFIGNDAENIEIKELCFTIISNLCKGCNKNKKQFRSKGGVDLIIQSLKDPNICKSERNALYTLSVLDCLWNAVLGNKKSESLFLDNEGFYVLMEFIEACDEIHRKMSLTCLSQLVENIKTVPYFIDWSSIRTMNNSTQLLIKLYSEEDRKYSVYYRDGVLMNIKRPLNPRLDKNGKAIMEDDSGETSTKGSDCRNEDEMNVSNSDLNYAYQEMKNKTSEKTKNAFLRLKEALEASEADSEAGAEAYLIRILREKSKKADLRAIIFSILYRTGFDINEIDVESRQRLEVIQIYPQLKVGEIWSEIQEDLEREGIKPTADDLHWMLSSIEEFTELVINCQNTQTMLARESKKQQEDDLKNFYDVIRSNKTK